MPISKLIHYSDNSYVTGQGTLLEGFETFADWTLTGAGCSLAADSTHRRQGLQSLRLNSNAGTMCNAVKTISEDLSAVANFIFWVYIDDDIDLTNFSLISLHFSSVTDWSKRFYIDRDSSHVKHGWNRFVVHKAAFTAAGGEVWSNTMIRMRVRCQAKAGLNVSACFDDLRYDPTGKAKCILTFDDTHGNVYDNAKPRMDTNGQSGVTFVVTDDVDASTRLTKAQLMTMQTAGWDIANHSKSHIQYNSSIYFDMSSSWTAISGNPTQRHTLQPVRDSVILEVNKTVDGLSRKYLAYDSDPNGSEIRLYYTDDLDGSWTPYSGNPILGPSANHYRWPSTAYVGGTFHMFLVDHTDNNLERWTSADGITFALQETVVTGGNQYKNPFIWKNPNDSKWYLYYRKDIDGQHYIQVRAATNIVDLDSAGDVQVLTRARGELCASPSVLYYNEWYWLTTEDKVGVNWLTRAYCSASPTTGFVECSNSPILTAAEDAPCAIQLLDPTGTKGYLFYSYDHVNWYARVREVLIASSGTPYTSINLRTRRDEQVDDAYDWLIENGFSEGAKFYAYPYGEYSESTITKVKERHRIARGLIDGDLQPHFNMNDDNIEFLVKTRPVIASDSTATIQGWIDDTITHDDGLLVLLFGEIVTGGAVGSQYNKADFETISDYLKTKEDAEDIEVITFSDLYDQFTPSSLTSEVYLEHGPLVPYPIAYNPSESVGRAEDGRVKVYKHPLAGDRKRIFRIKCIADDSGASGYKWRDLEYFYTKVVEGAKRQCVFVDANSVQYLVRIIDFAPRAIGLNNRHEVTIILEEDYS